MIQFNKSIERTTDPYLIKAMYRKEDMYNFIMDDGCPCIDEWKPNAKDPTIYWFVLRDKNQEIAGCCRADVINNVFFYCHVFIYEKYRGKGSEDWGKMCMEFLRKFKGAKKFLAVSPHIAAKKYAEKCGFKLMYKSEKSFLKNGNLIDQYFLEAE